MSWMSRFEVMTARHPVAHLVALLVLTTCWIPFALLGNYNVVILVWLPVAGLVLAAFMLMFIHDILAGAYYDRMPDVNWKKVPTRYKNDRRLRYLILWDRGNKWFLYKMWQHADTHCHDLMGRCGCCGRKIDEDLVKSKDPYAIAFVKGHTRFVRLCSMCEFGFDVALTESPLVPGAAEKHLRNRVEF